MSVNLAASPYYDDFDDKKNFHRVLFNPRRAVQVRELNQLQSILQNQVERFGKHIFKDGSMVEPGEINYDLHLEYVTVSGINFDDISGILAGAAEIELVGGTSAIVAKIVLGVKNTATDPVTFYIRYISGGDNTPRFKENEVLTLRVVDGNSFATATVIATGQGSVLTANSGIYFTKGFFVRSESQMIILSKYSSTPTVVAGFRLNDSIVDWNDDESLLDNTDGTNYNAIGADRLKLTLNAEVHGMNDVFDRTGFIEIAKFDLGNLQSMVRTTDYSALTDTLARRTYDESGDYTVRKFNILAREHLLTDDNGGLYPAPDGDLSKFVVGIEPGKAYVRGYEVENIATVNVSVDKARDTALINNSAFSLPVGNYITVDTMNVTPKSDAFQTVTFYSGESVTPGAVPPGTILGTARVRYTELSATAGQAFVYLFDVKDASGNVTTSFIKTAKSVYSAGTVAFTANIKSELIDSVNHSLVFKTPVSVVKSLTTSGSDTSLTVNRQYTMTADTSGVVVLTAGANEVFATPTTTSAVASYTIGGTSTTRQIATISTMGGAPLGKTLTINFGAPVASQVITITVEVIKEVAVQKNKTVTLGSVTLPFASIANRQFKLGKADAFKITAIIENGVNKLSKYTLSSNKNQDYYGISFITLKAGEPLPTANVTVTFEYFTHGAGDFFSVDSYSTVPYEDIPSEWIGNASVSMADVIDFRPRMNDAGTSFTGTGGSVVEVPSPYSLIRCDIEHYLPRVDKVYVNSKGQFGVVKGVSDIDPKQPATPDNAMAIYVLNVPAYTKSVKDISMLFINNRRYTMRDIGQLDDRIKNIEYYTALNMLETETESTQITDPATGLNRFKNGFMTDGFVDHSVGSFTLPDYKCAISSEEGMLRPEFYADSVDFTYSLGLSSGVVQTGALVTLPFTEALHIQQLQASELMNVNPYAVYLWYGDIELTPNSDTWYDTVYTEPNVQYNQYNNGRLTQSWNSWGLNWSGGTTSSAKSVQTGRRSGYVTTTTVKTSVTLTDDRIVSQTVIPYMRSRAVAFKAKGLLPYCRVYAFFDNVPVTNWCKQDGQVSGSLVTDVNGAISGTFWIPNQADIRFRTGSKQFTLIDNTTNNKDDTLSYADEQFTSTGILNTRTQSITATRQVNTSTVYWDPLAQSFLVAKSGGMFITSIDLYFGKKDSSIPVSVQIRNMDNGYPGKDVVPYSNVIKSPSQVNISSDASVATNFKFSSPVYLTEGQEYCFVIMSNSNKYEAWVARMGGLVVGTKASISKQPFVGVLFKSQNNSTWTADQSADLKFKVNIAKFSTNTVGTASFVNTHPDDITLGANPLVSTAGSNVITASVSDHGMFVGSIAKIAGIDVGLGIPLGELNKNHVVQTVIDADTYTILTTTNATTTGSFGGNAVTSSRNMLMNTIQPMIQDLTFENTTTGWAYTGITGKSLSGTEVPYVAKAGFKITQNANYDLSAPLLIPSAVESATNTPSTPSKLVATLSTEVDNISPVIDVNRVSLVGISNRINSPAVLNETTQSGGNAIARYITNAIGLKNAADSLKVYVDVNKPQGSNVLIYYCVGNSEEELEAQSWTLLPSIVSTVSADDFTFSEFEYGINDIAPFSFYQFKIVMVSTSSSKVPKLKRLRGIALGT